MGAGGDAPGTRAIAKILQLAMRAVRYQGREALVQILLPAERVEGKRVGNRITLWSGGPRGTLVAVGSRARPDGTTQRAYALEIGAGYLLDAMSDIYGDEMKRKVDYEKRRQRHRGQPTTF